MYLGSVMVLICHGLNSSFSLYAFSSLSQCSCCYILCSFRKSTIEKNQSFVYKHDFSKDQNCRYILCYQCPVFVTCILTRHVVFTQWNKMHLKRKACFLLFQDFTHDLRNYQKSSYRIPKSVDVVSLTLMSGYLRLHCS